MGEEQKQENNNDMTLKSERELHDITKVSYSTQQLVRTNSSGTIT